MSNYLKITARLYLWLAIFLTTGYVVYIIYDDYVFIEKIDSFSGLGIFLLYEFLYMFSYFLAFTFFYILIAFAVIFGSFVIRKFRLRNAVDPNTSSSQDRVVQQTDSTLSEKP